MPISPYARGLRERVGHGLLISPAAAACIRDPQGRILLLRRGDGEDLWGFPGGMIEPDERADQAVARETHEETGLQVEAVSLIGVYTGPDYRFTYPNGDRAQPLVVFFECRVTGGELRPDLEESLELRYFGPGDEWPPMRACCAAKARDAFAYRGRAFFH